MSLQTKAFLYQFIGFAILFIGFRFLIDAYTHLNGIWISLTAFVVATIISPKFQAVKTSSGDKLFVKWLFLKGVKQIK